MASVALYLRLVGARVRGQLQYRVSFLLQVASSFTSTFVELLAIVILFSRFSDLAGWTVGEVAFLYGLVSVAFGLTEMLGAGFDEVSVLVRTGEFDRVLTRPVSTFVQVLAADFQLRRVGRIAQGALALALAQRWLAVAWTLPKALVFLAAVLSSASVFFTVLLVGAAICFWTVWSHAFGLPPTRVAAGLPPSSRIWRYATSCRSHAILCWGTNRASALVRSGCTTRQRPTELHAMR